jgi:ABC-type lipoprotein export system ATPase subunit
MILVTHDSPVARRAERIGVMRDGQLTFAEDSGSAREPWPARTSP